METCQRKGKRFDMPQSFDDIPVMMSVEVLARVTGRSEDSVRRGIRAGAYRPTR